MPENQVINLKNAQQGRWGETKETFFLSVTVVSLVPTPG
jgi:hypothetical protein